MLDAPVALSHVHGHFQRTCDDSDMPASPRQTLGSKAMDRHAVAEHQTATGPCRAAVLGEAA